MPLSLKHSYAGNRNLREQLLSSEHLKLTVNCSQTSIVTLRLHICSLLSFVLFVLLSGYSTPVVLVWYFTFNLTNLAVFSPDIAFLDVLFPL